MMAAEQEEIVNNPAAEPETPKGRSFLIENLLTNDDSKVTSKSAASPYTGNISPYRATQSNTSLSTGTPPFVTREYT